MLEDQDLSFCRLVEALIRVVALDDSGGWLASRCQTYNDLLALELGEELRGPCFNVGIFFFGYILSSFLELLPVFNFGLPSSFFVLHHRAVDRLL